ncbi:MAG: carbohydrate binding domain-containing protein [Anaerolineae bacterium]|nr:carbohydrate binding domain-containing protein [Anaerolineae bacterium]
MIDSKLTVRLIVLWLAALSLLAILALAAAGAGTRAMSVPAAPPACLGAMAALTFDYRYATGSAELSDPDGDAEAGSTYRWLVNGTETEAGEVGEGLLLHLDGVASGANGEAPDLAQGVGYQPGRWGQALALADDGALRFGREGNLALNEGTLELWAAPRADGDDPVYGSRWHVLFFYQAPDGDSLTIAQAADTGIVYAGGTVDGAWQSAYGARGDMRAWQAGEWHHLAFAYSASGNFMRFYVDGVLAADTNEGHYWPPSAAGTEFYVGGTRWNEGAHYFVDEVRLSGHAATGEEIASRAERPDPAEANEMWLATEALAAGDELVYEFTPAAGGEAGAPCGSTALTYPGIPVTNPDPPTTLLPAGTTQLSLSVESIEATACAYALGGPLVYGDMTPFDAGAGTTLHHTLIPGLDPNPNVVNDVYVRCAAHPDFLLPLHYRSLSAADPGYPRAGNLWGWWGFADQGLPYMARIDLWLGADGLGAEQIVALRGLNPDVRVLTSINAVENNDLSHPGCAGCAGDACESWYLKDVNGQKIEVWPGSYRINLTKVEVAEYQGCYAYQSWLASGYQADGVFFDNVMTSQSWLTHDIYGHPIAIDADEDGVADDPAALDAAWQAGVLHEIETFRQLMPHAVASSHSTDIYQPGIASLFNGISIGFSTANVLEGEEAFSDLLARYHDWLRLAVEPATTMIESSPLDDMAYGYDYEPLSKILPSTLEFARNYTPWMRFGLALTLMDDGYFAHEFGDTWHGNDWWYDELDFDLGHPLGPAERVALDGPPPENLVENGGFEQEIAYPWHLWANTGTGCAATVTRDTADAATGSASARIDVAATSGTDWHIEFAQYERSLAQGTAYDVTFWARSDTPRMITLSAQQGSAPWDNYGLWRRVEIGTGWQEHAMSFEANATAGDARLQFLVGQATGSVWLDEVRLSVRPPDVYRRAFDQGLVLLNGTREPQTIDVGPGYKRLAGSQAPREETILDDAGPGLAVTGTWTETTYDSGEWQATGPFYHDWGAGCHEHSGTTGEARWSLPIAAADVYTITAWWPAAPEAAGWSANARYEVVAGGQVVATQVLDQRSGGDEWHLVGEVALSPGDAAYVRLSCPGACIADALHIRSRARYNDGSPAAEVTLAPMDGIVLRRAGEFEAYLPVVMANSVGVASLRSQGQSSGRGNRAPTAVVH